MPDDTMFLAKCYTWQALHKLLYTVTYCLQPIPFLATSEGRRNLRSVSAFDTPMLSGGQCHTCLPHRPAFPRALQTAPSCMKTHKVCQVSPASVWALSSFRTRRKSKWSSILVGFVPHSPHFHPWWRPAHLLVSALELEKGKGGWPLWLQSVCVCVYVFVKLCKCVYSQLQPFWNYFCIKP